MDCRHCHAPLAGSYCSSCGQKALADDALTARAIGAEVWQHATDLFKTLRSLRALFVPGKLTADYISGNRRPYLSPLKVYLLCGAIFFMAAPYTGFTLDAIVAADGTGLISGSVNDAMARSGLSREHFEERFELRFQSVCTASLALSVAVVALLNAIFFLGKRRPAAAHVVFALHYVAFLYVLGIVSGAIAVRVSTPSAYTLPLLHSLLAPYLYFSLRRVYADTMARTIVKMALRRNPILFFLFQELRERNQHTALRQVDLPE
ncbi:MAG: DUF3667 domain-containing protein [Cyanobacteria bacterium]|nr:DUF3667 domain-containing protein [Cyanobacteriota bacterium]